MTAPIIALLSDFGLEDHYAGTMKAAALTACPGAVLVDITHHVPPQDIARGAYELAASFRYFPSGTVFLAVVDPGVGTSRLPVILQTPAYTFVGPDNGLFALVAEELGARRQGDRLQLTGTVRGWAIEPERVATQPLSATFHGRDLFAPAAGWLANGEAPENLGRPLSVISVLGGGISGHRIIAIDHFGNLITNYRPSPGERIELSVGGVTLTGPLSTYGDASGLLILTSSSGYLEIARSNGSAAETLGRAAGDAVSIRTISEIGDSI